MDEALQLVIVMVKPKAGGNVGSAARALKNMGFSELRLVAPGDLDRTAATNMAVHARDVLDNAKVYPDLRAAVADCFLTVGTTCKKGPYRRGVAPIREAAPELAKEARRHRVAIIFGPEDFGLSNEELRLCQRLIIIPTSELYPSINLAQAIMLVVYEVMMASQAMAPVARGLEPDEEPLFARAPVGEVDAMLERLKQALLAIGFLSEANPERIILALKELFGRSGLNRRELDIWNGLARQVEWFARGGSEVIEHKRRMGIRIR